MRELTLQERSVLRCAGGGFGTSPLGQMRPHVLEEIEGLHVAAAAVGSVATAVGYTIGSTLIGPVNRIGVVRGLSTGWIMPFAIDAFQKGRYLPARLGRAAFIGAVTGLAGAVLPHDLKTL